MRAKGTVKPSEKPRVKSERNRMRRGLLDFDIMVAVGVSGEAKRCWRETSSRIVA